MQKSIFDRRSLLLILVVTAIILTSFILGFHNALLYQPRHGFDGKDHLAYMHYLNNYRTLPPTNLRGEMHQSPVYYLIGTLFYQFTNNWKSVQFINIFVLWMVIGMVGIALTHVFKDKSKVLVGLYSLAALPMLNIFPPMVTNELLNTFWIISCFTAQLFLLSSKSKMQLFLYSFWFALSFVLGYWTKVSVILVLPTFFLVLGVLFITRSLFRKWLLVILLTVTVFIGLLSAPLFLRARQQYSASDVTLTIRQRPIIRSDLSFYYRLDWIPKVDMYNTQYYSMLGGAWNSFWTDGHNAITPFIKFHKKSFILWSLGFFLLPLSIYGLFLLYKKNKTISLLINSIGVFMILVYCYLNIYNHYSAARLTYEMGIILPYSFGLVSASTHKKIKILILILLSVQFITMVSFYWIQPWWHVTK